MPSTRRSRKHSKWGKQAAAQWQRVVDPPTSHGDDRAIPSNQREQFPKRRAALAEAFGRLSPGERRLRANDFRRKLRAVCASENEFRGFWSLRFEPLLVAAAAAKRTPKRTRESVPDRHAGVESAIRRLVGSKPDVLTQKTCRRVLAGSDSPTLREAGLDKTKQFGEFAGMPLPELKAHVAAAIDAGCVTRGLGGRLKPR